MNSDKDNNDTEDISTASNSLATRRCALELLENVLRSKTALDIALDRNTAFVELNMRDRAFTRMLVTTTIRRLGQIDDLIAFAQERPDALKTDVIRNILRLGITQIFFMNVPDHASVDTCVRLSQEKGMSQQSGFINAILRRLTREGLERLSKQDAPRLNTPEWLLKLWIEDYGLNIAARIAEANMNEAPLDVTIKNKDERAHWASALQSIELSTGTLRRTAGGNVRDLQGYDEGKWWIQDAAAAIPAMLFGDITGTHIIDICAAPGGKTMQLVSVGAHVTSIDRSAKRLKRLEENVARIGLTDNVQIEVSDAASWTPSSEIIESGGPTHILLDAPCSATGTIRRHPDTGYLKSPKDIEGLTTIQQRLLNRCGEVLAVGGTLIYCTCSLQKAEGEHQIAAFLNAHPNFERSPIKAGEIGNYEELINEDDDLRIFPFHLSEHGGLDGFFVSRLSRIS
jgi:16S rRNA (cytosine967-C5)-methyltransferase